MSEWYQVKAKIVSQIGALFRRTQGGGEFIIGDVVRPGMCSWAFYTLSPLPLRLQSAAPSHGRKT